MDFSRSDVFDELTPRTAPAPESFAPVPFSSTVPEVSLVFSPPPLSQIQRNKKSPLHNSNNAPNLFASSGGITEKQLHDIVYNTLQKERLAEKHSSVESVSPLTSNSDARTSFINDKSIGQQDVHIRKTIPSAHTPHSSVAHNVSRLQDVNGAKSYHLAPSYDRHASQTVNAPLAFRSCGSYSTTSKGQSRKATNINVHTDLHGGQISEHHCPENIKHSSQIFERPYGCDSSRLPTTTESFDCYSCGKQQCCSNHNKCLLGRDMIKSRSTFNAHGHPVNSEVQHPFSHSDACNYGSCCMHNMPHIETVRKFENEHVHNGQTGRYLNTHMNVSRRSDEYNRYVSGNNEDESIMTRKVHSEEDIIPSQAKRNKYKLKTNVHNLENVLFNKGSSTGAKSTYTDVPRQDARCMKNHDDDDDDASKTFPDSPGKQRDRKCTDTSILQEIALMNHKQCSILQGLLQQVVVMQADQMKILSEINEKLRNNRITGDAIPNKQENNATSSNILSKKEDASTQTIVNEKVDFCCQKSGDGGEIAVVSASDTTNSPKVCTRPAKHDNVENKNMFSPPVYGGQECEQNKTRKFQDRGVSWSAVHGVETVEESFTLHGVCVPTVVEQLPSSVHTMHLRVQDYHSSASFDSIKESRFINDSSFENGQDVQRGSWTLYDNIVGHVKKFLQTVPCENGNSTQKTPQVEAIRFATIEKIRQLGVSVYENSSELKEVNVPGKIHFDSNIASRSPYADSTSAENNRSDASIELQALAHKYLQDEDLSDLVKWNQSCKTSSILKPGQKSANISLATQHYLEKYQLLPVGSDSKEKQHITNCVQTCVADNILDITTLKKQPKLL